jgi:hypothetical protein
MGEKFGTSDEKGVSGEWIGIRNRRPATWWKKYHPQSTSRIIRTGPPTAIRILGDETTIEDSSTSRPFQLFSSSVWSMVECHYRRKI